MIWPWVGDFTSLGLWHLFLFSFLGVRNNIHMKGLELFHILTNKLAVFLLTMKGSLLNANTTTNCFTNQFWS